MIAAGNHNPAMAIDEILINAQPGETRIAMLEADRLVELLVSRPDSESVAGNVYLGRVERVLSGLQAAFVEVGLPRAGFLALSEARPASGASGDSIGDYVKEGDKVVVQVLRDAFEDKGVKLTAQVTLAGRCLIHTPGHAEIKISRRINDPEIRANVSEFLQAASAAKGADGDGFVARTAAATAGPEDLNAEIATLRRAWATIRERAAAEKAPSRLWGELDPALRVLRDEGGGNIRRIVVDDGQELTRVRSYCEAAAPGLAGKVFPHTGGTPLFVEAGVEEQIEEALSTTVPLPSGGNIIISETPALTAIDVNSGGRDGGSQEETAYRTNLEAAATAAGQIRLRNLSGLLVIDFVAMKRRNHGTEVLEALRKAVASDPGQPHVIGYTRLGLVEMTRRKRRESLSEILADPCPACSATGRAKSPVSVAFEALRAAEAEQSSWPGMALGLWAGSQVIEAFAGPVAEAHAKTEARLGRRLVLMTDETLADDAFQFGPADELDPGDAEGDAET